MRPLRTISVVTGSVRAALVLAFNSASMLSSAEFQ
jgi:hypothetical protein